MQIIRFKNQLEMLRDNIDYLKLERRNHNAGSYNAMVQELVKLCRYIREGIPGTEIPNYMPAAYELERKLHQFDAELGDPPRSYVLEVMETLENEPEVDHSKSFRVFILELNPVGAVTFSDTSLDFPQRVLAEEWIQDEGDRIQKYVILEVIDPSFI